MDNASATPETNDADANLGWLTIIGDLQNNLAVRYRVSGQSTRVKEETLVVARYLAKNVGRRVYRAELKTALRKVRDSDQSIAIAELRYALGERYGERNADLILYSDRHTVVLLPYDEKLDETPKARAPFLYAAATLAEQMAEAARADAEALDADPEERARRQSLADEARAAANDARIAAQFDAARKAENAAENARAAQEAKERADAIAKAQRELDERNDAHREATDHGVDRYLKRKRSEKAKAAERLRQAEEARKVEARRVEEAAAHAAAQEALEARNDRHRTAADRNMESYRDRKATAKKAASGFQLVNAGTIPKDIKEPITLKTKLPSCFDFGYFIVDYDPNTPYRPAKIRGENEGFTERNYRVLLQFYQNRNRVISSDNFVHLFPESVRPKGTFAAAVLTLRTTMQTAFGWDLEKIIQTLPNRGGFRYINKDTNVGALTSGKQNSSMKKPQMK